MPRNKNYRRPSVSYTDSEGEETDREEDFEDYGPPKESVIIFLDVDSFDVQVRGRVEGISSEILKREPFIVVNEFQVITAVNYPAKRCGVTRDRKCTKEKAIRLCQENDEHLNILEIPNHHGKPDNLEPSRASDDIYESIVTSLKNHCETLPLPIIEKKSKDEFYVDVTDEVYYRVHKKGMPVPEPAHVQKLKNMKCLLETPRYTAKGKSLNYRVQKVIQNPTIALARHNTEGLLMHGADIARNILEDIQKETLFTLSAGVASNKLLAKIGCGIYKPEAITILPHAALPRVSKKVKIENIPSLGGKDGREIKDKLKIETMFQLGKVDRTRLQKVLKRESALEYHLLAIGQDNTPVFAKRFCDSLTCGLKFSYRGRRMFKVEDFHENLWKRFLEMEDHIDYNYNRHGSVRIPKSFRLEVCTRKSGLKFAFKETVNIKDTLRAYIVDKSRNIGQNPWKDLHDYFLDRMRLKMICDDDNLKLFSENNELACGAVRKVSGINLVALFA